MLKDSFEPSRAGPYELRKFGLAVGVVLVVVGSLLGWKGQSWHGAVWGAGLLLAVLGLSRPVWLRWVYVSWMTAGLFLGHIVSTLILMGLFFLMVTPLGWLARLMGRDFLQRKGDPESDTYWQRRNAKEERARGYYERQY